jgi:hypothetical protein
MRFFASWKVFQLPSYTMHFLNIKRHPLPSCLKILEKGTLLNVITSSLRYQILSTFELGRVQRYTYLFASHLDGTHFLENLCATSIVCQTYRLCVVVRTFLIKLFVDVSVV